jgi:cysteinyl-tRNA synthetase
MLLYNTLTRTRDELVPHTEGEIRMYTCGPTVYHFAHIGNLRTYLMEDVLERTLSFLGYRVIRAMNITDVGHLTSDADTGEDKMLKGARREKKTVMEIAKFYTDAFFADCKRLNIRIPEIVIPATSCIDEFIRVIERLLETGYAYEAGGNIYFDTSRPKQYNVFHDFDEDDLAVGVREGVDEDGNKRNKTDFVLWFTKSKFDDQELKWDSPFGVGYPGWHIECSCISMKHLGEHMDIHCGGVDNIFPHHTNEVAQSEAYLGHPWCSSWFHVAHLNTSGGKMSKSKGEFLTLDLLSTKGYDPLAYRFFCLQSHYRKSLVFSYENLDNAATAYRRLLSRIAQIAKQDGSVYDEAAAAPYLAAFSEALENDLNTSLAVTALYDVLKSDLNAETKRTLIARFDTVLALDLLAAADRLAEEEKGGGISDELREKIERMIADRAAAKREKNYAEADRIRSELAALGVTLKDTPSGTTYTVGQ